MDWESSTSLSSQVYRNRINVVLFGEVGVGKSCVVNLIARKSIAKVSSDVNCCTIQYQCYPISFDDVDFAVYDTTGFGDPDMEVNSKPMKEAYELISKLSATGGIHLLLFCIRAGFITAATLNLYRLICEYVCDTRVPIALVFTGLEREDRMEDWWDRNRTHVEYYGIKSYGHACITAVRDDTPGEEDKYKQSQEIIRELLKNCARKVDVYSPESQLWFTRLGMQLKEFLPAKKNPKKKDIVKVLTNRCKLDADTARRIAEMMDKGDTENKVPQPGEGASPQEQEGATPQLEEGTTLQPQEDVALQLKHGMAPPPKQGVAQPQKEDLAPLLKQGVTLLPKQGAKPRPGEGVGGKGGSKYEIPDEGPMTPQPKEGVAQPLRRVAILRPREHQEGTTSRPKESVTRQGVARQFNQGAIPQLREGMTTQQKEGGVSQLKHDDDSEDGSTIYEEINEGSSGRDNQISDATLEKMYPSTTRVKSGDTNVKAVHRVVPNGGRDISKKSMGPGGVASSPSRNSKVVPTIGREGSMGNAEISREKSDDEPPTVKLANVEERKLGLPSLVISFGP